MGILTFALAAVIGYELARGGLHFRQRLAVLMGVASVLFAAFRLATDYRGTDVLAFGGLTAPVGFPLLLVGLFVLAVALGFGLVAFVGGRRGSADSEARR